MSAGGGGSACSTHEGRSSKALTCDSVHGAVQARVEAEVAEEDEVSAEEAAVQVWCGVDLGRVVGEAALEVVDLEPPAAPLGPLGRLVALQ